MFLKTVFDVSWGELSVLMLDVLVVGFWVFMTKLSKVLCVLVVEGEVVA
jgi:hypothetical protein